MKCMWKAFYFSLVTQKREREERQKKKQPFCKITATWSLNHLQEATFNARFVSITYTYIYFFLIWLRNYFSYLVWWIIHPEAVSRNSHLTVSGGKGNLFLKKGHLAGGKLCSSSYQSQLSQNTLIYGFKHFYLKLAFCIKCQMQCNLKVPYLWEVIQI